ncbi:MAG TPA: translocation/assembly module TamB domain-containing protein [Chthoniobacterales bacterium]
MEEPTTTSNAGPQPRRRPWRMLWRWTWRTALLLLVLAIVFHRPLFFGAVRLGLNLAEKPAKMRFEYAKLSGSIWSDLEIEKFALVPTAPNSIEKLTLDRAKIRYHLWEFVRGGLQGLVESVEVNQFFIRIDGKTKFPRSRPPKPRSKRSDEDFDIPIPFPKMIDIEHATVEVATTGGLIDIHDVSLSLLPAGEGRLYATRVAIPGVRTWTNLAARTTYINRDLNLWNFKIADNVVVDRLQIDASQIGDMQFKTQLNAQAFGGPLSASYNMSSLGGTNDMELAMSGKTISLKDLVAYFNPESKVTGQLQTLDIQLTGEVDNLRTWSGTVQTSIADPGVAAARFEAANVDVTITHGVADLKTVRLAKKDTVIAATGSAEFPGRNKKQHPFRANITITGNVPDVKQLESEQLTGGSATLRSVFTADPQQIKATLDVNSPEVDFKTGKASKIALNGWFSKAVAPPDQTTRKEVPWWKGAKFQAAFSTGPVVSAGYQIDGVAGTVSSAEEKMTIGPVDIHRASNTVHADGTFDFSQNDLNTVFQIRAPVLKELALDPANPIVEGSLAGNGTFQLVRGEQIANITLAGTALEHKGLKLGELNAEAGLKDKLARITRLELKMPNQGFVQATGNFNTQKVGQYGGQISMKLPDLGYFKPLLGAKMKDKPLDGALQVDWSGTGDLSAKQHEGRTAIHLTKGRFDTVSQAAAEISGYYTPRQAEFPKFDFHSSHGNLSATVVYADKSVLINDLRLTQATDRWLEGSVRFPLDLENVTKPAGLFPLDGLADIRLTSNRLDLGKLQTDLHLTPVVAGTLNMTAVGSGKLENPIFDLNLAMTGLRSDKVPKLEPADIQLMLSLKDARASLNGRARQSLIQPLTLAGDLPFDVGALVKTGKIDPNSPVHASVRLPQSSLANAAKLTPALRELDGSLSLEVDLGGTLAKPRITGNLKTGVNTLRFRSNALPVIRSFAFGLDFRENVITISSLKGDLAGGPFQGGGTINITDPKAPQLDIRLGGKSILFTRSDNMIVRSNLDLTLKGPLASAELAGTVALTDSRFFRDIDILPFSLPGKPAPPLPSSRPNISITAPPVRDWKFNVDIKTQDPFLVRGNLANGTVIAALKLGGTGLAPTLDGSAHIQDLIASLPFSRLYIDYGNVYFSKDLPPLGPILDIRGHSRVRDYNIDVYVWGDALKPQTLFLSQPPLSQEDVMTLLGTGVTQQEITENPQLLAGRAGWLVVQKYYNKIFRRKATPEQDSLLDRVDIEIGNIDPKTGHESATARLRLSDKWQIVGDLDLTGGARGQIRYLLRFR